MILMLSSLKTMIITIDDLERIKCDYSSLNMKIQNIILYNST